MSTESRCQPLVTVSLNHFKDCEFRKAFSSPIAFQTHPEPPPASVSFSTLDDAFGQSSLGILLVKDLPLRFSSLRHQLLSYASYLANLSQHELGSHEIPLTFVSTSFHCPKLKLFTHIVFKNYFPLRRPDT